MVHFSKLRINGFKSFPERAEIDIAHGLNGIVGPNGCGKSNLVEALRWVMGESSAKKMRGGGMEDVIFSGTNARTQRNIAEVSLLLDNSARTAPPSFNGDDEIEITRRIERDRGSVFKINGRTVRARDVQMFFADSVTGANSPAIVSQGRVTQIINAKPQSRRIILEESAGIAGLYARRHEAELRLKAADNNLLRIEDILGSMEGRLAALKRQSRQASRYRNINTQIRQVEMLIAHMEWQSLEERKEATRKTFAEAESQVAEKLSLVSRLSTTLNEQSEDIPSLREEEAKAAAALQSQKITLQRLEDEAARLEEATQEMRTQLEQAKADHAHESQSQEDSAKALERLDIEQKALSAEQDGDEDRLAEKKAARDELEKKVLALEEQYTAIMESAAETRARKQSLEQQIEQNNARLSAVRERKNKAVEELETMPAADKQRQKLDALLGDIEKLEKQASQASNDIENRQENIETLRADITQAQAELSEARQKRSELQAEITMLDDFLNQDDEGDFLPVLGDIKAAEGFEKALSRALGESLLASLDEGAPSRWIVIEDAKEAPSLPDGTQSLQPHINAPEAMMRALSQIGLVEDETQAKKILKELEPGQSLVSQAGDYWRWDGFCVRAEASDQNALRLEQKNKLDSLIAQRPAVEDVLTKADKVLEEQKSKLETALSDLKTQQDKYKTTQNALNDKRREAETLRDECASIESNRQKYEQTIDLADEDIKTLEDVLKWDGERLEKIKTAQSEQNEEETQALRDSLAEARESYQAALSAFDIHQQEQNSRRARMHAIADERISLQNRNIRARERIKELSSRQTSLEERLQELGNKPNAFKDEREKLLSRISDLGAERDKAAERLSARESDVQQTRIALKEAENELSDLRESRAGAQATLKAMEEQMESLRANIREQFDMQPAEIRIHSASDVEENTDSLEALRAKKEKLTQERERIGPVNLRADDEAQELEKEVTALINERNDLMQAIEELRSAISKINKEARERLIAAFEHVNAHFQSLFTRLFAGGKAHLALIDSDDPLGAGLEIFAQPPGKSLQSLSLLSGGEQTLASIALIFAMFLTNPSPICILDEIDAPLDDANVDRVCDLLEEIAERGTTRFLIVSHHRLTMARMDRLYGVTMAEQGVSQLVSVDLQQSFEFLEEAA